MHTKPIETTLPAIQAALLAWFHANGRDLPWRKTRDPYNILVSEIMLQQTQVDRVVPKYLAFLEQFPDARALAAAPVSDVIRAWSGLGYNRRAVNLQRACRAVIEDHNGEFPRTVEGLRALPGVGPYTAGAVACFAFEQDVAFMDTNIRRVVQRLFVGPQPASEAALLTVAAQTVPAGQGWAWNQAIMELGALICVASNPRCWRCPLREHCCDYAARQAADAQVFDVGSVPAAMINPAAKRPRVVAEKREAPYAGSTRYYRGRLVEVLRGLAPGEQRELAEVGPLVKPDFTPEELPWLRGLAEALARDGLIALNGERVGLPE